MKYFNSGMLSQIMLSELKSRGVDEISAKHVVDCLIQTSLRGVDSHGINLFPHYCRAVKAGRINSKPKMTLKRTGASTAVLDADHAFGHMAGAQAMMNAISFAKAGGIGAVNVSNSTHFSAAAYYGLMAAEQDCLGFSFTNADALVKAVNAKEAFFGTNPICFTAPLLTESPLCLDMATSQVSWNKIMNFRREGNPLSEGWAFDENGINTLDPEAALSLNPAGGYKGFGLGMMVDILCATLTGSLMSKELKPMYSLPLDSSKREISHFFMAIDVSYFSPVNEFKKNLQNMVNQIREMSTVDGSAVMVPGDPEKKNFLVRSESGIPIDELKLKEYLDIHQDFCLAFI
jgi:ureidoglycolate dehydrogenase (NAD+)